MSRVVCVKKVIKNVKSEQEPKNNKSYDTLLRRSSRCRHNNEETKRASRVKYAQNLCRCDAANNNRHRCKKFSSAIWMTDVRWWEWLWWIDDFQFQQQQQQKQRITVRLDVDSRFQASISYINYKIKSLLLVTLCLSMLKIDDKKLISDHYYFLPLLLHSFVVLVAVQTIHCVIVVIIIIRDMMRCFIINFIGNIFLYCCQCCENDCRTKQKHPVSEKSEQQLNILPFTRNFIIVVVVVVRKRVKDAARQQQEKSIFIECDRCEPNTRTTNKNNNNNKFIINNNRMRTKNCCDQITCNERTKWNMKDIFLLSAGQGIELLIKFILFLSLSLYKSIVISTGVVISLIAQRRQKDNAPLKSSSGPLDTPSTSGKSNYSSSRRKSTKNIYTTFLLLFICIPLIAGSSIHANVKYSTNIIKTKYGPLRGILVRTNPPVEAFLGVPYATPPVGSLR